MSRQDNVSSRSVDLRLTALVVVVGAGGVDRVRAGLRGAALNGRGALHPAAHPPAIPADRRHDRHQRGETTHLYDS